MQLPADIRDFLAAQSSKSHDYEQLSKRYRAHGTGFNSQSERLAYLIGRLPATYAAIYEGLKSLSGMDVRSMIDWGAGPGTGLCVAREVFPSLGQMVLIEQDEGMIRLGKELIGTLHMQDITTTWNKTNALSVQDIPETDLALFSYFLGEIPLEKQKSLLLKAWEKTQFLLVVEPGTPRGFATILAARETLLQQNGYIVAPCPHHHACPLNTSTTWCHFAARVERTRAHRLLKEGSLGYEDEKFSYVLVSKHEMPRAACRLTSHPQKGHGHIKLELCSGQGLRRQVVTKGQAVGYKWASKAKWGEGCSEDLLSQ
jgi:ribosomal protein RSM22 (predicted rRNA methylase)